MRYFLLLFFVGYIVSGCSSASTHHYTVGNANLNLESDKTVAVTTVDTRPYVRSGEKSADFVGVMGGFGIPFDITTANRRPFANVVTDSIVASLKGRNVNAVAVKTQPAVGEAAARKELLATDADRYLMFLVREWKSDTYINTDLKYHLSLSVLQKDGSVIAENNINGDDYLGTPLTPDQPSKYAENAFRQKLEAAFANPTILAALQ